MLSINSEDIGIALRDTSEILKVASVVFLIPIAVTLFYAGGYGYGAIINEISTFLIPSAILYFMHLIFKKSFGSYTARTRTKHAMMTVALGWLIFALVGSMPYFLTGTLDPVDSFFESMSGWTTTGMTMIKQPETCSNALLFYRSLTQWIGGVGIVVFALIIFMRHKTVAMDYYASEVGQLRIRPSIRNTVIETWKLYGLYTLACAVLLFLAGMNMFDAINHALTTLPTGGFSTHEESIAFFNNGLIEIIIMIFMFIGGINFILHLRLFEGMPSHLLENIEFRSMVWMVVIATVICFCGLWGHEMPTTTPVTSIESMAPVTSIGSTTTTSVTSIASIMSLEYSNLIEAIKAIEILETSLFQTVSIITTTGFGTADISKWDYLSKTVLLVLMLIGGSYGSTGSGIKMLRVIVVIKVIFYSLKKYMLPKTAVVRLKIHGNVLGYSEISQVIAFLSAYLFVILFGTMIFNYIGYAGYEAVSISISAISNVGPVYVMGDGWFNMPDTGKLTIVFLMWIGRLEIFPVLILLNSLFIKKRGS